MTSDPVSSGEPTDATTSRDREDLISSTDDSSRRAAFVLERLARRFPNPRSALNWSTPWELLVSTVLAAQCTDARVNMVTPEFFRRWPGIPDLAAADLTAVEQVVHSTGFFRMKAKNLIGTARLLVQEHDAAVPRTMDELVRLPGVARKTANIVLSNAFGIHEGLAVDTHVKRLAFRLGFTTQTDPKRIERELMRLFPQSAWGDVNHYLVLHGRATCTARSPRCAECELARVCPRCGVADRGMKTHPAP